MRSILSIAVAGLMLAAAGAPRVAAEEQYSVNGVLVDASCFKKDGAAKALSEDHLACAKDCLKKGQALGIFTDDTGLVRIMGEYPAKNVARLTELLGKQVEAKGTRVRGNDYTYLIDVSTLAAAK